MMDWGWAFTKDACVWEEPIIVVDAVINYIIMVVEPA
jgi:hypothetical protein